VERHLVAVAGLDVAVQAVVGDVQLPVLEPLVERRVGVVQGLLGLLEPVEELVCLFCPKALEVALGLLVERQVLDQRLLAKFLRRRKLLNLEELREIALQLVGACYISGHLTLLASKFSSSPLDSYPAMA